MVRARDIMGLFNVSPIVVEGRDFYEFDEVSPETLAKPVEEIYLTTAAEKPVAYIFVEES